MKKYKYLLLIILVLGFIFGGFLYFCDNLKKEYERCYNVQKYYKLAEFIEKNNIEDFLKLNDPHISEYEIQGEKLTDFMKELNIKSIKMYDVLSNSGFDYKNRMIKFDLGYRINGLNNYKLAYRKLGYKDIDYLNPNKGKHNKTWIYQKLNDDWVIYYESNY